MQQRHFVSSENSIKEGGMTQQSGISQGNDRPRILVVDDEVNTRTLLKLRLQREGYRVEVAGSGQEALALVNRTGLPRLAILNILMPEMDGFALAEALHRLGDVPIIFLSALSDIDTKVRAFSGYAEDYVNKPFAFAELLVRIHNVLTRTATAQPAEKVVVIDERLRINFAQHLILVNEKQIKLTSLETQLLWLLYRHRGRVLSPDFLLANAWPDQHAATRQALRLQIHRLRIKLEPEPMQPRYLVTIHGQGYCLPHPNQTQFLLYL